ncbi:hypothetical protein HOC01_02280 [archaeon]|jgi:hypothetical protein|nr:hypothetical protein [archaeon]MBT6697854.1 hypothetical protein [archaeon]
MTQKTSISKIKQTYKTTKLAVKRVWFDRKSKLIILALTASFIVLNAIILELFQVGKLLFSSPRTFIDGIYFTLRSLHFFPGVMMILLSLLSAILIAMVLYALRIKKQLGASQPTLSGSAKASAGTGIILTLIAPACPSCGIGVLSAIGLTTLGSFLPFGGQEFSILGIIVLLVAITYTAKQIEEPVCKI